MGPSTASGSTRSNSEGPFVPTLKPGDVVILDNLLPRRGGGATCDPQRRGAPRVPAEILSRPTSISIEQVFAKFKTCCERREREATKPYPKPVLTQYPPEMRRIHQERLAAIQKQQALVPHRVPLRSISRVVRYEPLDLHDHVAHVGVG